MTPEEFDTFQALRDAYWDDKTGRAVMEINLYFMSVCGISEKDIRTEIFGDES